MKNLRMYGKEPYNIVVVHGGPGAPGSVGELAKYLGVKYGVLEPFQTKDSIDGQISELKDILKRDSKLPVILIGHSWGAWLSYMFSVKYPEYVKKLILISSGPYEEKYLASMQDSRTSRLSDDEKKRVEILGELLFNSKTKNSSEVFKEFGSLMTKADSYEALINEEKAIKFEPEIFKKIMTEVCELRQNGRLLSMGKNIKCPVIAIHGDYDAHPYKGVLKPLTKVIDDFEFILLNKCGHSPWNERYARDEFYRILENVLNT